MEETKKYKITKYLLLSLCTLAYIIVAILIATKVIPLPNKNAKIISSVLVQASGILVSFLPLIIELIFKIRFSVLTYCIYLPFCLLSLGLGSGCGLYDILPHFDIFLHTVSGALIAFLIYASINTQLKDNTSRGIKLFLLFLFTLLITLGIGCIWETWEFTMDEIAQINCQRYADANGVNLIGHEALMDTMVDIICNTIGAMISSISLTLYYFVSKKEPKNLLFYSIKKEIK